MKDEAVSPVVAFMLLLMVVVSFISLLNAYYIPSLKQQAEIEHLGKVEESFLAIGTDIDRLVSFKENAVIKERMSLGGGDVLFSAVRSTGTLQLSQDIWLVNVLIVNASGSSLFNITTFRISYRPTGNFWVNQGYQWRSGIINVTKNNRSTWLEYIDQADATRAQHQFIRVLTTPSIKEMPSSLNSNYLENVFISMSNLSIDKDKMFMSSNGGGGVDLVMKKNEYLIQNVAEIKFTINPGLTSDEKNFLSSVLSEVNTSQFKYLNCEKTDGSATGIYTFTFPDPSHQVNITFGQHVLVANIA